MPGRVAFAACFVKKPNALFGVIDEGLQQARARNVVVLVADIVRLAHRRNNALIVVAQFRQHVLRLDVGGSVIGQPLLA